MADIYGEGSNSKKQWQKLKGAPLSEKIKYIATYYGIPIIAGIAIIVFAVSMTRSIIYNSIPKIIALECYSGYGADNAEDNLMQAMSEKLGVDPSKYHIEVAFSGASTSSRPIRFHRKSSPGSPRETWTPASAVRSFWALT